MNMRSLIYVIFLSISFFFVHKWFLDKTKTRPQTQQTQIDTKKAVEIPQDEIFYVLENDYMQLVFSNIGGALAEINLPFQSKVNTKSIVHPIEFDKQLEKSSPKNEYFPLNSYYSISSDGTKTFHKTGKFGGYYPLLRRKLKDGTTHFSASYYACNILFDSKDLTNQKYHLKNFDQKSITFEASTSLGKITKRYVLSEKEPYIMHLFIDTEGIKNNLWLSSGIPEIELTSGHAVPILKYRTMKGSKSLVEKISLPKGQITSLSVQSDWICNSNGFLGIILDPLKATKAGYRAQYISGEDLPTRLSLIDSQYNLYPPKKYPGYELFFPIEIQTEQEFRIFAGPFQDTILKYLDSIYSNPTTGYFPDYEGAQSSHGWFSFISAPFAKLLFLLMQLFHRLTNSWGLSIILLTIALRIMLYPLNSWSIKSNVGSSDKMKELGPKIKAVQARYKKDPKKVQMETMKLYREAGINPLSGCFPLLIQMPFLIGMFDLLKSTFELRGATFIPGWINNLTAPDVLFSWSRPLLFLGTQFHLLPFILGITMFIQQKFTTKTPKNPQEMTEQQRQMKVMSWILPVFMTFIFYKMPSGLNIYFLSSTLLGILQQWWLTKKKPKQLLNKQKT